MTADRVAGLNTPALIERRYSKEKCMKHVLSTVLLGLFVLLIDSHPARAQARAQISGIVKDQSGAILPGVEVTVTQTETGISRSTLTNETGGFELPNLPL